jgi:hypothetical protein
MQDDAPPRRTGPVHRDRVEAPKRWPRRVTVVLVSPDRSTRDRLCDAIERPGRGWGAPAEVLDTVPSLGHAAAAVRTPAFFVIDARTEDARALLRRPYYEWLPLCCPRLWVRFDDRTYRPAPPPERPAPPPERRPPYVADADLRWDRVLGGVPLRTRGRDDAFAARLRGRVALLAADVRSEHLFAGLTRGAAQHPPIHQALAFGCPTCAPGRPQTAVGRTSTAGMALLHLMLRPEWYVNATGYATQLPGNGLHGNPRSPAARVERACRAAALVSPRRVADAALVLRASALAAAFGVRGGALSQLLGFSPRSRDGAPVRSTWSRRLERVLGVGPALLSSLQWPDIDEAVRRAVVALSTRGPADGPADAESWTATLRVRVADRLPPPRATDPDPLAPPPSHVPADALRPILLGEGDDERGDEGWVDARGGADPEAARRPAPGDLATDGEDQSDEAADEPSPFVRAHAEAAAARAAALAAGDEIRCIRCGSRLRAPPRRGRPRRGALPTS